MSGFLPSLGVAVTGTIIGGLILAGVVSLIWRFWRTEQEERLLREFLKMAQQQEPHSTLAASLLARTATSRAKLQDPDPVLKRLVWKDQIRPFPNDPEYYSITFEGRNRAQRPRGWRRMFG